MLVEPHLVDDLFRANHLTCDLECTVVLSTRTNHARQTYGAMFAVTVTFIAEVVLSTMSRERTSRSMLESLRRHERQTAAIVRTAAAVRAVRASLRKGEVDRPMDWS